MSQIGLGRYRHAVGANPVPHIEGQAIMAEATQHGSFAEQTNGGLHQVTIAHAGGPNPYGFYFHIGRTVNVSSANCSFARGDDWRSNRGFKTIDKRFHLLIERALTPSDKNAGILKLSLGWNSFGVDLDKGMLEYLDVYLRIILGALAEGYGGELWLYVVRENLAEYVVDCATREFPGAIVVNTLDEATAARYRGLHPEK